MIKEGIAVVGAIAAANFAGPKLANALVRAEINTADEVLNKVIIHGSRFGTGLLAYFLLRKFGL